MKKRLPTATVDVGLRVRESLRAQVEQAAKSSNQSMNAEIVARLTRSFDEDRIQDLSSVCADMQNTWHRYGQALHELNKQGDLLRATETLLSHLDKLPDNSKSLKGFQAAIEQVKNVTKAIQIESARAVRGLHTTGGEGN